MFLFNIIKTGNLDDHRNNSCRKLVKPKKRLPEDGRGGMFVVF
jgi:hypothetical protein